MTFYTYKNHDATEDEHLVTIFFAKQAETVRHYVDRRYWTSLDLQHFLRFTWGSDHLQELASPERLDILQKHCDFAAKRPRKISQTRARKREVRKLSRRMRKLAV